MIETLFDIAPKVNKLPLNPDEGARGRFPKWLHRKLPKGEELFSTESILQENRLHTVCEEAKCPNRFECFSHKTATFLVLGKECTRACGFCDIAFSNRPKPPDSEEGVRVAHSVKALGLKHVVLTMVARDDLPDGGASHLKGVIERVREENEGVSIEVLTSDFAGNEAAFDLLLEARPEIFNYNIETVRRLTPRIRHKATYERTLSILSYVKRSGKTHFVKSGMMCGFGEQREEVKETIADLKEAGVDIMTIGQYLQPSRKKLIVQEFVTPERFAEYEMYGLEIGIHQMYVGPFVRSSYNAGLVYEKLAKV